MHLSNERLIVILLVGVAAGYLAGRVVRGSGFGLVGDAAVGIVGHYSAIGCCFALAFISSVAYPDLLSTPQVEPWFFCCFFAWQARADGEAIGK